MKGIELFVAPYDVEEFYSEFYEKNWHHFEKIKTEINGLFDFNDLEEYLFVARPWTTNGNELRCVRHPEKSFEPQINSFEELLELYAEGHTIVLNSVHRRWPKIAKMCSQLSNQFFCRVNANIYVTPANSKGFEAHFDTHDVFIIQTEGSKIWSLAKHEQLETTHIDDSYRHEFYEIDPQKDIENAEIVELRAGQCLYVPRGTIHSAQTQMDTPSIHITFSIFPITWGSLLQSIILDGSLKDTELMKTVPFKILEDLSSNESKETINRMMQKAISLAEYDSTWRFLYNRDLALQPGNGIDSIHKLNTLSLDSRVSIRDGSEVFVDVHKNKCWISFSGRRIKAPISSVEFLYFLSENYSFYVKDLPAVYSESSSKLNFAKWLITKGVATFSNELNT